MNESSEINCCHFVCLPFSVHRKFICPPPRIAIYPFFSFIQLVRCRWVSSSFTTHTDTALSTETKWISSLHAIAKDTPYSSSTRDVKCWMSLYFIGDLNHLDLSENIEIIITLVCVGHCFEKFSFVIKFNARHRRHKRCDATGNNLFLNLTDTLGR